MAAAAAFPRASPVHSLFKPLLLTLAIVPSSQASHMTNPIGGMEQQTPPLRGGKNLRPLLPSAPAGAPKTWVTVASSSELVPGHAVVSRAPPGRKDGRCLLPQPPPEGLGTAHSVAVYYTSH